MRFRTICFRPFRSAPPASILSSIPEYALDSAVIKDISYRLIISVGMHWFADRRRFLIRLLQEYHLSRPIKMTGVSADRNMVVRLFTGYFCSMLHSRPGFAPRNSALT